jgi:hypothetical protein
MKYKIIKSDLFLNGKLIPENSEVELSESEINGIKDFIVPCHSERAQRVEESPNSNEESQESKSEKENKTKRGNK